jgi:transcriptional regulator with XRE-family HTH domain
MEDREMRKQIKHQFDINVGMRVRVLRESGKLTQEKFAEILGVRPQYISKVERGQSGLSTILAVKMSNLFCVPCDYILKGKQSENTISSIVDRLKYLDKIELEIIEQSILSHIELIAYEKTKRNKKH